jgi:hypothetical protein
VLAAGQCNELGRDAAPRLTVCDLVGSGTYDIPRLNFLFDLTKGKNESFQIFTRGIRGKDLHRGSELEQRAGDLRGARGARQREFSHMGRVPAGSLSK